MSNSRRWVVAVVAAILVTGVAFAAGAAFPNTHRIVDANGDVFDVAAPFTVDTIPPEAAIDAPVDVVPTESSVEPTESIDALEDPDRRGRPPRSTPPSTTLPPTPEPPPPTPAPPPPPPSDPGGDVTQISGFVSGGFTVPAGETWAIDGEVTVDGDVTVMGTLQMRAGDTLTLDTSGNCQTQVMVMEDGLLDAVGTAKTSWTRDPQNAQGWLANDEVVVAPIALGDYEFKPWDGGPAPRLANNVPATEVLNLDRDVVIQSTVDHCGRVIFEDLNQPQYVAYVEVDGLGIDEEVGWYPIHMHMNGDAARGSLFEGVVVKNSGNHAFVFHGSHGVTARDVVAFDVVGPAYWWDPTRGGTPENATDDIVYDRAVAAMIHPSLNDKGKDSFTNHGFSMMAGTGGVVVDSVAVGVLGPKDAAGFGWPPNEEQVWLFEGNVAHNNTKNGIWVWHNSPTVTPVNDFVAYSNGSAGVDNGAYNNSYQYTDLTLHNNGEVGIDLHAGSSGNQVWTNVTVTDSPEGMRFSNSSNPNWPVPFVCYEGPAVKDARVVFYGCDDVA